MARLKVFREALLALQMDLGGLLAGSLLAYQASAFTKYYWTIILYPLTLSVRGAVNGAFSGRLTTGLHLRLVEPKLKGNTEYFYTVAAAFFTLTFISSLLSGILVFTVSYLFYKVKPELLATMLSVSVTSQCTSVLLTMPSTSIIAFLSYRMGADPDVVTYPVSSTVADVTVTLLYLSTLLAVESGFLHLVAVPALMYTVSAGLLAYRFKAEEEYRRTLAEALGSTALVASIAVLGGGVLSSSKENLGESYGVLLVYPALIDTLGDASAIFGSISTTKLALGLVEARFAGFRDSIGDIVQLGGAVSLMFTFYSMIGWLAGGEPKTAVVVILSLPASLLPALTFSFGMALLTFRRGLDPDNFVIPLETVFTDTTVTSILSVLLKML